ncbi:MAG TPA: superoxide dismutase family protein, partial [Thermoanaerobaculia bacterium]|nr:superoxide dismutase family protein [Thermoanaerobaculia bacterium]
MRESKSLIVVSVVALLLALGCVPREEEVEEEPLPVEEVEEPEEVSEPEGQSASATLRTADGTEVGTVTFTEGFVPGVSVSAHFHDVEGDGQHGFHVHQNGECTPPDFTSAGDHFNPESVDHACPPTTPRHAGDFGNVEITGGTGASEQTTDLLTVAPGATSVVGKAVLLHAMADD